MQIAVTVQHVCIGYFPTVLPLYVLSLYNQGMSTFSCMPVLDNTIPGPRLVLLVAVDGRTRTHIHKQQTNHIFSLSAFLAEQCEFRPDRCSCLAQESIIGERF